MENLYLRFRNETTHLCIIDVDRIESISEYGDRETDSCRVTMRSGEHHFVPMTVDNFYENIEIARAKHDRKDHSDSKRGRGDHSDLKEAVENLIATLEKEF